MTALIAMVAGLATLLAEPVDDWRFGREGEGERRARLDAAELLPFDAGLLSKLGDWKNGAAPDALRGHVVAVVFWDNDEPASVRAVVPTLKRLDLTYGKDGLLTLAVHGPDHWDAAQERIDSGLFSTLIAHDADGSFAASLGADGTPDTFLIDRAGNLRFADLDDRDLPAAVRALMRETPEEASSAGQRRAEHAASIEAVQSAKDEKRQRLADQVAKMPPKPADSAYASASWPQYNKPKEPANLYAKDVQGKPLPVPFGKSEKWLSEEVPLDGRVVVLDFWATWCGPCIAASPKLDALQKKYGEDLRVIGVSGQGRGPRFPEDEASIRAYMDQHKVAYSHVNDTAQAVYRSLQIVGIPHVVVLSSDGVVRWQGLPDATFQKAVEQALAVDPWVAARRAVE